MNNSSEKVIDGVVKITANKHVQFQVLLSNAETWATTSSFADVDTVLSQLERETYGITSNEKMQCKKELSVHWIKYEAWWQSNCIEELWNSMEQCLIHIGYFNIHSVSYLS